MTVAIAAAIGAIIVVMVLYEDQFFTAVGLAAFVAACLWMGRVATACIFEWMGWP